MSALLALRPYQSKAIEAIHTKWDAGVVRIATVLPTGGGKTVIFSHLAEEYLARNPGKRVLVLAHTDELVLQAAAKMKQVAPHRTIGIVKAERNEVHAELIVASVQSLRGKARRDKLKAVGLIVVDECHRGVAKTYQTILEHFGALPPREIPEGWKPSCLAAGFTATLVRADDKKLSDVWEDVAFRLSIAFMIRAGYLLDIKGRRIEVPKLDLKSIKQSGGDYQEGALGEALIEAMAPEIVAKAYLEHAHDRKGLLFAPTVESATVFAQAFNDLGIVAEVVHGALPRDERRAILLRLKSGETQVVANCMVLTEGFDEPTVSCVVMARPTKSSGLWQQCLDSETEILTDSGWQGIDSESFGRPAAYDIETGRIEWSPVLSRTDRALGDEAMYALSSPTADIRVTAGHRMVWRAPRKARRIDVAEKLASRKSHYLIPIAGLQDAPGVPLSDDELRFVGWVMTDGSIGKDNGAIRIAQAEHQPWNADIVKMLEGCGFKYRVRRVTRETQFNRTSTGLIYQINKGAPRAEDKHLRGWGGLEPWISKDLAPGLEDMTREQLAILLEAMHLGDGAKQQGQTWTRRSYHISTANRVMADRLQSLCVRRGFKCNVSTIKNGAGEVLIMHIKDTSEKWVGGSGATDREHLAATEASPDERVWCVETTAGTLVTRRHGKVAIVGNCIGRVLRPDLTLAPDERGHALLLDVTGVGRLHGLQSLVDLSSREDLPEDVDEDLSLLELEDLILEEEETEPDAGAPEPTMYYTGETAAVEFDPLGRDSDRTWGRTPDGHFYLTCGTKGYVFLVDSLKGDPGSYDLVWCDADRARMTEHTAVHFEMGIAWGEEMAIELGGFGAKTLTAKKAKWRDQPATKGQAWKVRNVPGWGGSKIRTEREDPNDQFSEVKRYWIAETGETLTKGKASEIIDAHAAAQRIDPLVRAVKASLP